MTTQLPPEDQPPGHGFVLASDDEVFADVLAHNPPDGSWAAGLLFHTALTHDDGSQLDMLRNLVTPESLPLWGDFSAAREHMAGTAIMSRADTPAPGVAYVKFVTDPGRALRAGSDMPIMARAVATLQFRPESSRWLVHQLGDYCRPEDLPALPAAG